MVQFTVEETNLLSIYHEGGKAQLMENMTAALPDMDADMRELARRTLSKGDYPKICVNLLHGVE